MSNNDSELWDKKYANARVYANTDDFFRFSNINPTILAIESYIKDGMRILEVGSGTGELISYLQFKYPSIKTYAVDYSKLSIERAKKVVGQFSISVSFTQANINALPFENNYFDIVFGDQVIGHIDTLSASLNEIHRVTQKNGIVAFSIANSLRPDGWYFNKTFSKSHQGYQQKGMFPWTLSRRLQKAGFKKINFYGEMLILFRNISIIKSFFISRRESKNPGSVVSNSLLTNNKKSFFKRLYYYLDKVFPAWSKVTIGIIARK